MIKPKPFKLICPKCGYSKKVSPSSDAIGIEMLQVCPKCNTHMERKEIQESAFLSKLFEK
jgi:DNA-directed RNA polymerase subunit M/transcription elongation factor TFIIS